MLKSIGVYLLSALLLTSFSNSAFAQTGEQKTAYALLLDNTRSLEKQFPQVLLLGKGVIKRLNQRGPISLFSFTPKPGGGQFSMHNVEDVYEGGNYDRAVGRLDLEWSQDANILNEYIDSLSVVRGHTDLLGAIHLMSETLNEKADAEKGTFKDRVIILITDGDHRVDGTFNPHPDGDDQVRRDDEKQLIKELKESGIRVFAVGLIRELNAYGGYAKLGTTKEKAEYFLKKITKDTGGRVVFPKSKNIDVDGLLNEMLSPK
jgi:hypothetical protein